MWMGICSKKYMEKVGKKKFRKHPIGVGPFKFVDRKVDEVIIFEPDRNNPEYNINFDRLEYRLVQDPVTRTAMLEAGELDLIYGIPPHQKKGLETNKNITVKKSSRVPSYFYLAIKPSLFPVIKDKNVRLAMNYAINRQEIIDRLYMKEGYPLYTFANVGELGFDSKIKYEYNPKKAASLLKNSSYKPGTPIRLSYTGMVPSGSQLASTVQHYLKEIGMTVELIELEWGTWITYSTSKDEKTAKKAGHMGIGVFPTHDPHIRMALSMRTGGPLCYYCNRQNQTKIDDLVEKQLQEMDIKKRISILKNIHQINFNDPGQVPLFGLNMIYAMNKRIDYDWNSSQMYLAQVEKIKLLE
jgi:peptide/nickel transport system substrate-binding protein